MIFWGLVIKWCSILQEKEKQKIENEKQIFQSLGNHPKTIIIIFSNLLTVFMSMFCIYA